MLRITQDPSSGSLAQCLAKNYKNDAIVSVDTDKVGVMATYSDPLCVCVVHCIWRHSVNYTHQQWVRICCRNTDLVHANRHDRITGSRLSVACKHRARYTWLRQHSNDNTHTNRPTIGTKTIPYPTTVTITTVRDVHKEVQPTARAPYNTGTWPTNSTTTTTVSLSKPLIIYLTSIPPRHPRQWTH